MAAALNPDALEQLRSKLASNYDVHHKLALPVSLMAHVWTAERRDARVVSFRVVNICSQPWVLQGHLRRDAQGHPKPEVFGLGWASFKRTMGLRVGDELVFYSPPNGLAGPNEGDEPTTFVVGVKRLITLGGATFPGHVTPAA